MRFDNVYVYSKSLNQFKYRFLKELLQPIDGVQYFSFSEHEEVVGPDNALPNSIIVFDDIACEKQENVRVFFCMGRHKKVDCFYLCQSYAHIPKQLVRDNVNLLAIFRQDEMNLKHVFEDRVNSDMSFTHFKDLCSKCWRDDKYGFLIIDIDRPMNSGRYRKGLDCFAINMGSL